jgi:hypothetical protein
MKPIDLPTDEQIRAAYRDGEETILALVNGLIAALRTLDLLHK